jgi:hypothetical protein
MMLQKTKHSANAFCSYPRLQRAAVALQQMLREKPALVTTISEAVKINKKSFYEVQGLSEQDMEALYATAYDCYAHEQYEEAAIFFQTFAFYSCFDLRAWTGLAASLDRLNFSNEAILCHHLTVRLGSEKRAPVFYTRDCYVALHKISQVLKYLETADPLAELSKTDFSSDQKLETQKFFCYQEKKHQQQNW